MARRPQRKRTGRSSCYKQGLTEKEINGWFQAIDDIRHRKRPKRVAPLPAEPSWLIRSEPELS